MDSNILFFKKIQHQCDAKAILAIRFLSFYWRACHRDSAADEHDRKESVSILHHTVVMSEKRDQREETAVKRKRCGPKMDAVVEAMKWVDNQNSFNDQDKYHGRSGVMWQGRALYREQYGALRILSRKYSRSSCQRAR